MRDLIIISDVLLGSEGNREFSVLFCIYYSFEQKKFEWFTLKLDLNLMSSEKSL